MFCTIRAATPRSGVTFAPGRAPVAFAAGGLGVLAVGGRAAAGLAAGAAGAGAGGASASPARPSVRPGRRCRPSRRRSRSAAVASAGRHDRTARHRRLVVGEEVVPGRVDAGRIGQVALVHLVDDPLVGTEVRQRIVLRSSAGSTLPCSPLSPVVSTRASVTRDGKDSAVQATPCGTRPARTSDPDATCGRAHGLTDVRAYG